jgi:hypothetical protein
MYGRMSDESFLRTSVVVARKQTTRVEGNTSNRLRVIFSMGFAAKWFDYRYLLPKAVRDSLYSMQGDLDIPVCRLRPIGSMARNGTLFEQR